MYRDLCFPAVATDAFRTDEVRISVDPTFACVVAQHSTGYDVFRYDESTKAFVFVCSSISDVEKPVGLPPALLDVSDAISELTPWLIEEVKAVKSAWVEFFDGGRQLPELTREEKHSLRRGRLRLVAGLDEQVGGAKRLQAFDAPSALGL